MISKFNSKLKSKLNKMQISLKLFMYIIQKVGLKKNDQFLMDKKLIERRDIKPTD